VNPERDFDVVIAGGGMVGAALAARLVTGSRTRSLRLALVEPHPAQSPGSAEPLDLRVSALSRAAERLLRTVGAWPRLAERNPCAYERMIVWDGAGRADGPDALVFDAAEAGEANLGHIAENRAITAALIERALEEGVTLLRTPLTAIELGADLAHVRLGERRIATGLVVAADGADSVMREWAGIGGTAEAYPQAAVVAHLAPELAHGRAARQRFLSSGPLALLPLADGRVSLVWSTAPEHAARLAAMDDAAFGAAVTAASDRVLGLLVPASVRQSFPLRRFNAVRYATTRLALVGDAAHSVHPLAGQGVNQGFLDVEALAAVIDAALDAGEDSGDLRVLGRYARRRRADNALMGAALDGIWRLFTTERQPARSGRRYGLGLVNRAGWLKRLLVKRALGP
jgi:2-octaprenylphenol hydroxylase